MKYLTSIKWTDSGMQEHEINLINRIGAHWAAASALLGLSHNHRERIRMNHHLSIDCCQEVMLQWLSDTYGTYNYPTSWEGLCELLEAMKLSTIAKTLKGQSETLVRS